MNIEIKNKIETIVSEFKISFQPKYLYLDEKCCLRFSVLINGQPFDYFKGCGHIKTKKLGPEYKALELTRDQKTGLILNKILPNNTDSYYLKLYFENPNFLEVVSCLFLDSWSGSITFNEFCDELGYNNDSIKAAETYRACQLKSEKLRKALGVCYPILRDLFSELEY